MRCALCGAHRPDFDFARAWVKDSYFPLCHGPVDISPTCYEKYVHGHRMFGERVTLLHDRVPNEHSTIRPVDGI